MLSPEGVCRHNGRVQPTRHTFTLALTTLLAASLAGCPTTPPAATGDSGPGTDGGTGETDTGAPPGDSGMTTCTPPSVGPGFAGCNPTDGIECDGDWRGTDTRSGAEYCTPACSADECCTPQHGRFACVARDAAGACPAADLFVDAAQITGNYVVEYRNFAADSCAIVEGTLGGSGMRRLLRFDTWTPNQGTADMFLGVPDTTSGRYTYSACHMHYHFDSYAAYELLTPDAACVVAVGHKQAFCLEDFYSWPCGGAGQPACSQHGAQYDCGYQGIEMGWQDVYGRIYDGQWIDVTGVPPGDYILRVRINTQHLLNESNYENNMIDVPVTITTDPGPVATDLTSTCMGATMGLDRACGFTHGYDGSCTAGAMVTLGCSAACGVGSCTGDTVLRVCDSAVGVNCDSVSEIASNDDSGCGTGACDASGGDCCSSVTFTCPSGGAYTVWTGGYDPTVASSCTIAVMP